MKALSSLWNSIQTWLLPALEDELGELTDKHQEFIRVCELCDFERHIIPYRWQGDGRPLEDRLSIAKSFVLKSVYNLSTTRSLIDLIKNSPTVRRLCGWESPGGIPSESTFSRAFSSFSEGSFPHCIHESMVKVNYKEKIVGHLSRDSSAIKGREKSNKKVSVKADVIVPKRKRGRPKKGEIPIAVEKTKVELQVDRVLEENLADLPTDCDWGRKKNSKGKIEQCRGYKLHIDAADGDLPISAVLTSASTYDNQVAIPLAQLSSRRVASLYDLMDAAYDTHSIKEFSKHLGHIPLIDHNPRRGVKIEMAPAEKKRYNQRSSAERVFSNLENYGSKTVRVRGAKKVMAHLMFGVVALTANQLYNMIV